MTYPDSTRHPVNRKLLTRLFGHIHISTTRFYKGEPCWEWTGRLMKKGKYGTTSYVHPERHKQMSNYGVHRLMYELFVGAIPADLEIDHLCRVRHCCNPVHLEAVPPKVNVLRGTSFAATNAVKTHCLQGHPLNDDNLILDRQRTKAGKHTGAVMRVCRECRRQRGKRDAQKWRDRRKAQGLTTNPYSRKKHPEGLNAKNV